MSSREIAELTGKPHNDLLKSIREMEKDWMAEDQSNFTLIYYKDSYGREQPEYQLNQEESLYVTKKVS